MKTLSFITSFIIVITTAFTTHAQKTVALQKENIKVWGECGMCKKKIEKAAIDAGAATASWNEDNKVLIVGWNAGKANALKVQQAVAAAGYDTQAVPATAEAYNNLPGCCHYQRKAAAKEDIAVSCCGNAAGNATDCKKDAGCCKDGLCAKDKDKCKDMAACKEKACCKS